MSRFADWLTRWMRAHKRIQRIGKLALRWWRAHVRGYPDWRALLGPDLVRFRRPHLREDGPQILLATSVGAFLPGTTLESLLGVALQVRGARVHVLLCDSALPACLDCEIGAFPRLERLAQYGPQRDLCRHCYPPAAKVFRTLGITLHRYGDLLTAAERSEAERLAHEIPLEGIAAYRLDGMAVGEHALAGALRFFARADLAHEPHGEVILRRYFEAALLTVFALQRLLARYRFECAVFHHGIYVPQGLIGEAARRAELRVVNWNPAYRKKCFIFSHGDTYHHTLMSEPVQRWEEIEWTPALEARTLDYLKSRWVGAEDWIRFHDKPELDVGAIGAELGIDFSKPTVGLLTNVMWDAQLHYPANAFPNMLEWLLQTIRYFARRPELQLVIRVHPAEVRGAIVSRQPVVSEVHRSFPALPPNVFIVPPESRVSTYAAMLKCNAVIIYGTKAGVELTSLGIPVIVAGEAWIRNKGVTLDATSPAQYFALLDRLPLPARLDESTIHRARKYAFHFFFRRMIPIDCLAVVKGWPPYRLDLRGLDSVRPGRDPGLDVVCEGILFGTDFIFPAERQAAGRR